MIQTLQQRKEMIQIMSQDSQNQAVQAVLGQDSIVLSEIKSKATYEGFKESLRLLFSFAGGSLISWAATQVHLLPTEVPIYFQSGLEPLAVVNLQAIVALVLGAIIRWADKYKFVQTKLNAEEKTRGLFWF